MGAGHSAAAEPQTPVDAAVDQIFHRDFKKLAEEPANQTNDQNLIVQYLLTH